MARPRHRDVRYVVQLGGLGPTPCECRPFRVDPSFHCPWVEGKDAGRPCPVQVRITSRSIRPVDHATNAVCLVHQDIEWVEVQVEQPVASRLLRSARPVGWDRHRPGGTTFGATTCESKLCMRPHARPRLRARSGLIMARSPAAVPGIRLTSAADIAPSAADIVPSAADIVPSAADIVPSAADIAPSAADIAPSAAEIVPSSASSMTTGVGTTLAAAAHAAISTFIPVAGLTRSMCSPKLHVWPAAPGRRLSSSWGRPRDLAASITTDGSSRAMLLLIAASAYLDESSETPNNLKILDIPNIRSL